MCCKRLNQKENDYRASPFTLKISDPVMDAEYSSYLRFEVK